MFIVCFYLHYNQGWFFFHISYIEVHHFFICLLTIFLLNVLSAYIFWPDFTGFVFLCHIYYLYVIYIYPQYLILWFFSVYPYPLVKLFIEILIFYGDVIDTYYCISIICATEILISMWSGLSVCHFLVNLLYCLGNFFSSKKFYKTILS